MNVPQPNRDFLPLGDEFPEPHMEPRKPQPQEQGHAQEGL